MKAPIILTVVSTNVLCVASSAVVSARSDDSAPVCGQYGWGAGSNSIRSDTYSDLPHTGCHNLCQATPGCTSFAFFAMNGTSDQNCQIYNVPVAGNFAQDDSSPWQFYDLSCDQSQRMCGVAGYDKVESWGEAHGILSASDCQQLCAPRGDLDFCQTFAFSSDGTCEMYASLAADTVAPDSNSSYLFYDATCNLDTNNPPLCGVAGDTPNTIYGQYVDADSLLDCQFWISVVDSRSFAWDGTSCAISVSTVREWYTPNDSGSFKYYDLGCKLADTLLCGVTGSWWGRRYLADPQVASLSDCQAQCNGADWCLSYAYSNGTCQLFAHSASNQCNQSSDGAFTFYDAGCTLDSTKTGTTTANSSAVDFSATDSADTTSTDSAAAGTDSSSPTATDDSATMATDSATATTDDSATMTTDDSTPTITDDSGTGTDDGNTDTDDSDGTSTDEIATTTTDSGAAMTTDDSGASITDGSDSLTDDGDTATITDTDDIATDTATADATSITDDSTGDAQTKKRKKHHHNNRRMYIPHGRR